MKYVTATSNDLVTVLGHKLDQTDHKGHRNLWGHKVGNGDVYGPLTFLGHKLGQTNHKGHHDLWGHKVGNGDLD